MRYENFPLAQLVSEPCSSDSDIAQKGEKAVKGGRSRSQSVICHQEVVLPCLHIHLTFAMYAARGTYMEIAGVSISMEGLPIATLGGLLISSWAFIIVSAAGSSVVSRMVHCLSRPRIVLGRFPFLPVVDRHVL